MQGTQEGTIRNLGGYVDESWRDNLDIIPGLAESRARGEAARRAAAEMEGRDGRQAG